MSVTGKPLPPEYFPPDYGKTPPVDSKGAAIDKILESLVLDVLAEASKEYGEDVYIQTFPDEKAKQAILAILAQEVKRVIGEDERQHENDYTTEESYNRTQKILDARNRLRAEQRRAWGVVE